MKNFLENSWKWTNWIKRLLFLFCSLADSPSFTFSLFFSSSVVVLVVFRVHPVSAERPQTEKVFKQAEGAEPVGAPPTAEHAADYRRPAGGLQPQSLQSCSQLHQQSRRLQGLQEQGGPSGSEEPDRFTLLFFIDLLCSILRIPTSLFIYFHMYFCKMLKIKTLK